MSETVQIVIHSLGEEKVISIITGCFQIHLPTQKILPGWIDTPLTVSARKDFPGLDDFVTTRTPAARWGKPKDFTGVAIFLASDVSNFVTAEYIRIDGGFAQGCNSLNPSRP